MFGILYIERLNGKDAVDWRVHPWQLQLGPHDGELETMS